MLQMQVYSERTSSANGIVTNVGEDAHPFVNNAGMFVADGMGGGAGVPILRFDERCFDPDSLARMLCDYFNFKSIEAEEEFSAYSKENFSSLSNSVMEELYKNPKSNTLRLKKSGYVGSHVLGAVLAAMLIHLAPSVNYPGLDYLLWKETIEKYRDGILNQYRNVISVLGSEYARVNIDKIDYYGTTMAAVFFKENEDSVDAIFLNCGDSRSYVWDSNGFRQACDDQGRNGGMTSRFSLGKDAIVDISFEVRNYKKPCSIFCMTDGFYGVFGGKNGFHSTPLYMEGFLMNVLSTQSSLEDAEARLKMVFDAKGQIDDSNSMVMASFGYDTYENLKKAARARLDFINQEYCLAKMPEDFLLVDYKKIVSDLQEASADSIKPLLEEAYRDEKIYLYCMNQIKQPLQAGKYQQEVRAIDEKIDDIKSLNSNLENQLYTIAVDNFSDFVDVEYAEQSMLSGIRTYLRGSSRLEEAQRHGKFYSNDCKQRVSAINDLVDNLSELSNTITREVDTVLIPVEAPWTKQTEEDTLTWVKKKRDYISEMLRRSQESLNKIVEYSRYITSDSDQWRQINYKLMTSYLDKSGAITPQRLVKNWIADALEIEDTVVDTTIPSVRFAIIELIRQHQENSEQIGRLVIERNQAFETAAHKYWDDNSYKDIHKLLKNDMYFLNTPSLKQQIIDTLNQNGELAKYEELAQIQEDVFEQYMSMHLSETNADKIADVTKNGWM